MICPSCRAENLASAASCSTCGLALTRVDTVVATAVPTKAGPEPESFVVAIDVKPGVIFHSRYEIQGSLGAGGMGVVYQAHDRTLDEDVAIKILRPDFARDPTMAERFKHEIKLARKVRHRNVCTIHDFGEDRGLLYISMELVSGVDLKKSLRQSGGLSPEKAYGIAIQVAEGLQAVHEAGIIHRDLKTSNIMVDGQGLARLMDFGVAKRLGEGTLTAAGHIVGTPEYMSPEQAQGRKADFRSDIYALGIVIYEIFTGRVPFRGETPISTILKHINDPPPLEGPDAAGIPQALRTVLRRALAKDPKLRQQSAGEVAAAVREVSQGKSDREIAATQILPAPRPMVQERKTRAVPPWVLPVSLAAVVTLSGVLIVQSRMGTLHEAVPPSPVPETTPLPRSAGATTPTSPPLATTETTPPKTATPSPASPPEVRATPLLATAAPRDTERPSPSPRARVTPAPQTATPPVPRPSPKVATPPPQRTTAASPQVAASPLRPASVVPTPPLPVGEPGLLQVAVRPWGTVSIDGKVMGDTPLEKFSLPPGPHVVRVRHPTYEPWEQSVTIRSGMTEKVLVDFPSQGVRKP